MTMTATVAAPGLDFVVYYVADLDAAFGFFTDVLGFAPAPEGDSAGFRQFTDGAGGGFGLAQASAQTPAAGEMRLYYKTHDLGTLREQWTASGASPSPIVALPFGTIFEVNTPDGHKLTAWQPVQQGA
jgi:predicted enzyme related to lactoylglutathione lyase